MLTTMAAIANLGLATTSRADITVTFSEDGGASQTQTVASGSPTSDLTYSPGASVTFGDFKITFGSIESNQSTLTELLSGTVNITNKGTGTHSIAVTIAANNYTAPTAPPPAVLQQSVSGNVVVSSAMNALTFNSSVSDGTHTYTGTALTPTVNGPTGPYTAPPSGTQNTPVTTLSAPFTLTQTETVTLGAGAQLQITNQTQLVRAVPEPGTIAMALTALPVLGLGVLARRRNART
jgi:hypothetical protein